MGSNSLILRHDGRSGATSLGSHNFHMWYWYGFHFSWSFTPIIPLPASPFPNGFFCPFHSFTPHFHFAPLSSHQPHQSLIFAITQVPFWSGFNTFFSLLDIYMWWVKVRIQTWERTCCICLSDPDLPHLNNVSQFHLCSWNSHNLIFLYRCIKFHRHMYHIFLSIRLWMNVSADKIFSLLWNQQW